MRYLANTIYNILLLESYFIHQSPPQRLPLGIPNMDQNMVRNCVALISWLQLKFVFVHVLSAKMFENPDVSGLLSLHQWKMPLH